jgi:hypothetical protein
VFLHLISKTDMALKVGDFGLSATLEAGKRTSRVGTHTHTHTHTHTLGKRTSRVGTHTHINTHTHTH